MSHRALIVEDDKAIAESIEDMLDSLGHEYVWVSNQQDGKTQLSQGEFSYVLLDLQIPAKPRRGGADVFFGVNLLADIQTMKGHGKLPVIVMTGHYSDGLDLAKQLFDGGARDIICKPFTSKGRTLADAIRNVLTPELKEENNGAPATNGPNTSAFAGGDLVIFQDRVTFLGQTICSGPRCHKKRVVLRLLAIRRGDKSFTSYSGEELESEASKHGVAGNAPGWIRGIRDDLKSVLKLLEIACEPSDLLLSGDNGYRFSDRLNVQLSDDSGIKDIEDIRDTPDAQDVLNVPNRRVPNVSNDTPEQRANWILKELGQNRRVNSAIIAIRFGCTPKTGQRDLDALKAVGLIEFVGAPRNGEYRLVRAPAPN